jgi:hypothetical protein
MMSGLLSAFQSNGFGAADGVTLLEAADGTLVPAGIRRGHREGVRGAVGEPVTVSGEAVPVLVMPPGFDVTVYPVIARPPFVLLGAVKLTVAVVLPAVAVPMTGASGTVPGVTAAEAADSRPVPMALVAWTRNVYAVPL